MSLQDFYSQVFLKLDDSSKFFLLRVEFEVENIEKVVEFKRSIRLELKGEHIVNVIKK